MYRRELLGEVSDPGVQAYTSSMKDDVSIAKEVVEVMLAHVRELGEKGLMRSDAVVKVTHALTELLKDPSPLFEVEAEDVHEALEKYLADKVGSDAGWVGLGRSRNDHVAAALRLRMLKSVNELIRAIRGLRKALIRKALENLDTLMPAFTHLQPAQVTTLAHYLAWVEESLATYEGVLRFIANEVLSESPLGSGACVTTNAPLGREALARKAGFTRIVTNSIRGAGGRDFLMITSAILTCLSVTLSRFAEDLVVFTIPQFNYLEVPQDFLATSSLMPHKKNQVVAEIIRSWGGESIGHLTSLLAIVKGVPSGYSLDLQEANKHAIRLADRTLETVKVLHKLVEGIEPVKDRLLEDVEKYPILTTDYAELISLRKGIPYREAHALVAKAVKESHNIDELYGVLAKHLGHVLSPEESIMKPHPGSPNPEKLEQHLRERLRGLLEP